jgi:hypothetical protein
MMLDWREGHGALPHAPPRKLLKKVSLEPSKPFVNFGAGFLTLCDD